MIDNISYYREFFNKLKVECIVDHLVTETIECR